MKITTVETPVGVANVYLRPATRQEREQYSDYHPYKPDHYMVVSIKVNDAWHQAAMPLPNEAVYSYVAGKPYDNVIDNLLRELGARLTLGHA
jgi:hypothetical protein